MCYASNGSLDAARLAQYAETGFLVLKQFFDAGEVAAWQAEANRLCQQPLISPLNLRADFRTIDGVLTLERLDPVLDISPVFTRLSTDVRLAGLVRSILGDEGLLFKDRLIFKVPGMTGYVLHQDAAWWQGFPVEEIVNLMLPLDAARAESGALELFPIRERRLLSAPGEIRHMRAEETDQVDLSEGYIVSIDPGDLLAFSPYTPHRSGTNLSAGPRRQLYLSYSASKHGDLYLRCRQQYQYNARFKGNPQADRLYFE